MGLETGTYINDLVVTNPTSGDPKSQGDDHLRLIKTAIKNTIAGFTGPALVSGADGGAANAYTLTPAAAIPAYAADMVVVFFPTATNTTTTPTLAISGLTAATITRNDGTAVAAGDLVAGAPTIAIYDGTLFRLASLPKNYVDQLVFTAALPAIAGNDEKGITNNGAVASWAYRGGGGALITTDTTLTLASPGAMSVTMPGYGYYITLPNATTLQRHTALYSIYNAGNFTVGVKDNAGTTLGWVEPGTGAVIGLADRGTAAGSWATYGLVKIAVTAELVNTALTATDTLGQAITVDANRTCFLLTGSGANCAVIYDASTKTWGAVTAIFTTTSARYSGVLSAANQILVVSTNTATTSLDAVTLTLSGTTITVNTGTRATQALGGASILRRLTAVGTGYAVAYSYGTTGAVRGISLSGTTPTIGAELSPGTVQAGAPPQLFVTGTTLLALWSNAGGYGVTPYTLSGATLTAGTAATGTNTAFDLRAFQHSSTGNLIIQGLNTDMFVTVARLVTTTVSFSTVSLTGVNLAAISALTDMVDIGSGKTVVMTQAAAGSAAFSAYVVTDTGGTASVGTALTTTLDFALTAVAGLATSGNLARFYIRFNRTAAQYTIDGTTTTPTYSTVQQLAGPFASGSPWQSGYQSSPALSTVGPAATQLRFPATLRAGAAVTGVDLTYPAMSRFLSGAVRGIAPPAGLQDSVSIWGAANSNDGWSKRALNNMSSSSVGNIIQRVETCA